MLLTILVEDTWKDFRPLTRIIDRHSERLSYIHHISSTYHSYQPLEIIRLYLPSVTPECRVAESRWVGKPLTSIILLIASNNAATRLKTINNNFILDCTSLDEYRLQSVYIYIRMLILPIRSLTYID